MADKLTKEDIDELRSAFENIDANGDGEITKMELRAAMAAIRWYPRDRNFWIQVKVISTGLKLQHLVAIRVAETYEIFRVWSIIWLWKLKSHSLVKSRVNKLI